MREIADKSAEGLFEAADVTAMEHRLFRVMCAVAALAVVVSAFLAPWRVTTGLALGGLLAVFSHRWLRASTHAMLAPVAEGKGRKLGAARFILRYFILAAVIAAAYALNLVSLTATLLGLCSYAAAALVEAFIQIYFTIAHRED